MTRTLLPVVLFLLLAACNKTEEPPPTKVNLVPASSPTVSAKKKPPEPYVDLESMPVEQDYEEEAEKAITPKTLLKKVDELEKDVDAK
jgi:hypothetical protein